MKTGKIFYIMGKSASGKDHLYRALEADPGLSLYPLILYTTRPMRQGELDGREYYFTDEAHLDRMRRQDRVIEERCYHTVDGDWYYFTADDGQIRLQERNYLGIGTLESYEKLRGRFGAEALVPLYIEVEDGIRLERALEREKKQPQPNYPEMCRRFLGDEADFSEQKLADAGISRRFFNNGRMESCVSELAEYIKSVLK